MARLNQLCGLVREHGGEVTVRILEKHHGFLPEEVERLAVEFPARLRLETKQNPRGGPHSRVLRVLQR